MQTKVAITDFCHNLPRLDRIPQPPFFSGSTPHLHTGKFSRALHARTNAQKLRARPLFFKTSFTASV
jgi:hypothetical protein